MLTLIAGEGQLPVDVVRALKAQGTNFRLCQLEGHPIDALARGSDPVTQFRVERLGSFIADLVEWGVKEVCFVGRISRPKIDPALIDEATMPMVGPIVSAIRSGDDAGLRVVAKFFEHAGISIKSVIDIVPEMLPAEGVLTQKKPDEYQERDAERGKQIIAALSVADVGQSCVVADGQALAIEAIAGTDWMLQTLAPPAPSQDHVDDTLAWANERIANARAGHGTRPDNLDMGGVLIKTAKPDQDIRFDLPTVGPGTIKAMKRAKLAGLVIEAGRVLVVDRDRTVADADAAGMFIWVRG